MKKAISHFLTALVLVFTVSLPAAADKDQPIEVNQLPAKALTLLHQHFKGEKIALAKKESDFLGKSYEVIFTNGDKIEFNQRGEWTDLTCQKRAMPAALVPASVATYVKNFYPQMRIVELDRNDRKGYDVKLSNGLELEFNAAGKVVNVERKK